MPHTHKLVVPGNNRAAAVAAAAKGLHGWLCEGPKVWLRWRMLLVVLAVHGGRRLPVCFVVMILCCCC